MCRDLRREDSRTEEEIGKANEELLGKIKSEKEGIEHIDRKVIHYS